MKKLIFLFLFLFLFFPKDVFAFEPSYVLEAKVNGSDLIIIGEPIKIEELERVDYERSDFEFKPDVGLGRREKIIIRDDGKDISEKCVTTTIKGLAKDEREIYLNDKRISEEEYVDYKFNKVKGKPKFVKEMITLAVKKVIKGQPAKGAIILESQRNFIPGTDGQDFFLGGLQPRILFLNEKGDGRYILFARNPSDKYKSELSSDIIIPDDDQIFVGVDAREYIEYLENRQAEINQGIYRGAPPDIPKEKFQISLDNYLKMIKLAEETR